MFQSQWQSIFELVQYASFILIIHRVSSSDSAPLRDPMTGALKIPCSSEDGQSIDIKTIITNITEERRRCITCWCQKKIMWCNFENQLCKDEYEQKKKLGTLYKPTYNATSILVKSQAASTTQIPQKPTILASPTQTTKTKPALITITSTTTPSPQTSAPYLEYGYRTANPNPKWGTTPEFKFGDEDEDDSISSTTTTTTTTPRPKQIHFLAEDKLVEDHEQSLEHDGEQGDEESIPTEDEAQDSQLKKYDESDEINEDFHKSEPRSTTKTTTTTTTTTTRKPSSKKFKNHEKPTKMRQYAPTPLVQFSTDESEMYSNNRVTFDAPLTYWYWLAGLVALVSIVNSPIIHYCWKSCKRLNEEENNSPCKDIPPMRGYRFDDV